MTRSVLGPSSCSVVLGRHRVSQPTYAGCRRGGSAVVFMVVLVIAVAVIVLVMRAAAAPGRPGSGLRASRPPRRPRQQRSARPLAPDDDPDFLRELDRRTRRDDGSPA